jgi:hypothetical protein
MSDALTLQRFASIGNSLWGSQSWLQPPFSGAPRPRRDVLNLRWPRKIDSLKTKGLSELALERRLFRTMREASRSARAGPPRSGVI